MPASPHDRSPKTTILGAALLTTTLLATGCVSNDPPAPVSAQGWNAKQQDEWYSATQGSRLMPVAWFRALEQPDAQAPFLDPTFIAGFRLLPREGGALPVGFAVDDNDDKDLSVSKLRWFAGQSTREQWVGLNCSACHTAEIAYQGKPLRIDGGPSLFDYQSFVEAIDKALTVTRRDPAKWDRFAAAVLKADDTHPGRDTPANREALGKAVDQLIAWEGRVEALNATPLRYGYGRVDAFGHIFNKVALFTGADRPTPNPADAPVSYPHLWDIYRHDRLQWNGIVTNARLSLGGSRYLDYGAMGRNTGEVIGVFGDVTVKPDAGLGGYKSSIWADNLIRMETQLSTLKSPPWPVALFGAIDDTQPKRDAIAAGKVQFDAHCTSCHGNQPGTEPYKVHFIPLTPTDPNATDPWMACNAITYRSASGNLEGTKAGYFSGEPIGKDGPLAQMLETTVKGAMVGKKGQIIKQTVSVFFGGGGSPRVVIEEAPDQRQLILQACYDAKSPFMAYKARPLDGIWATAPYLHNGSVASLAELLLPPDKRMPSFPVGSREYDPVAVGYTTRKDAAGNAFTFDTRLTGNSNKGHDYGVGALSPEQRQALLAYLKTL